MMDTIDNIIKFCKNPKIDPDIFKKRIAEQQNKNKEDARVGYDLYLELKKDSSISCNFYSALENYAKFYHEDTGIVPEKEFCVLRELIDLIQNKGIADIIEFVDRKKAYKEAFCVANVLIESKNHNICVLIQAYCFIEAGDAEEKKHGRNLLLNLLVKDRALKDEASDICKYFEDIDPKELFYMVKRYVENRELLASKFRGKEFL